MTIVGQILTLWMTFPFWKAWSPQRRSITKCKKVSSVKGGGGGGGGCGISNLEVHNVSNNVSTQDHELVAPEGFQVEGLSP